MTINLGLIGGSDVAALMGVDPWGKGPIDVYLRIVEGVRSESTGAMRKGHLFERPIFDWWKESRPESSKGYEWSQRSIHPRDRPWQRCTPDVVAPYGVADVKRYRDVRMSCGKPGTDELGDYELLQLTTYAECLTHLDEQDCDPSELRLVVHDLWTDELVEYVAEYSADLGARIVETCERFWKDHVTKKAPPPLNGGRAVRSFLESKYPAPTRDERDATALEVAELERLREIRAKTKVLDAEADAIENRLRASIGEHARVTSEIGTVSWTSVEGAQVSYYRKPYRVLKTTFRKEGKR